MGAVIGCSSGALVRQAFSDVAHVLAPQNVDHPGVNGVPKIDL